MKAFNRRAGVAVLLALVIITIPILAQESGDITVVGSGIVTPLFDSLAQASSAASGVSANLSVTVTGTNNGFASLCSGAADVVTANRSINQVEASNCNGANVQYLELVLGYDVLAFIAQPDTIYAQCLTLNNLNAVFAPSSQGQIVNWNQIYSDNPDLPIALFVPQVDSPSYALLDRLINGTGLRSEAQPRTTDAEIVSAVNSTSGAIGVVKFTTALGNDPTVNVLNLEAGGAPGCVFPNAESIEAGQYPAADRLLVYVNVNSLSKPGLTEILNFASGENAPAILEAAGFIAPTTATYDQNIAKLQDPTASSVVEEELFQIPANVAGEVRLGGEAGAVGVLRNFSGGFSTLYTNVTFQYNVEGREAGFRRFCNGEIDVVASLSAPSAEQLANCNANNITPVTVNLGYQAVVLLANPQAAYAQCLNTAQLGKIWSAQSEGTVTLWSQVDPAFPTDAPLTLFAPVLRSFTAPGSPDINSIYNDLLISTTTGTAGLVRSDTALAEQERFANNPIYRTQAVGNTPNSLTYMHWADYQQALNDPAVALVGETPTFGEGTPTPQAIYYAAPVNVALSNADGSVGPCVAPTLENISSGQYPLARPVTLYVNQRALALPEVQSFLWYIFQTENLALIEDNGLAGITEESQAAFRPTLVAEFNTAQVVAAEATPEATGEATAAPEATGEATSAANPEATAQPAAESTAPAAGTPEATQGS